MFELEEDEQPFLIIMLLLVVINDDDDVSLLRCLPIKPFVDSWFC